MKFCVSLLLLLLLDALQGSTLPHVRKVRALNTTLQTNFNGTYERINPCTNAEIESSSYIASHEFHHHTNEDNWSDYTHKCSAIISGFLQAIGNLVRFNNKQNGLFNFHINTSISQKQVGRHGAGKCCESLPTILIEATDCEVTPKKPKNIEKEAEEKTVTEGKYDGPVCLLKTKKKASPGTFSGTASYEQNIDELKPPIINSNQEIPQNKYEVTEECLKVWKPVKIGDTCEPTKVEGSQTVPGVAQTTKTTYEQISEEFENPAAPLPESELQVVPVTTSFESPQPEFGLENSPGFQGTAFENANERRNFNAPDATQNAPYTPQPSPSGFGNPPQPVVSISNEELIIKNQFPTALPNEQGLPAVQEPPMGNSFDIPPPVQEPPMRDSFGIPPPVQEPPMGNSFDLPPPVQAPPMKSSFDLPPPVQAPPTGNSFDAPPPVQEPPTGNSFDLPPPVQAPPNGNSFNLPPPVQAPPMKSSFDLPPPVQAPPNGNSFNLPPPVQAPPMRNSFGLPRPIQAPPMGNSFDVPPPVQALPTGNSFDVPPPVQEAPNRNSFDLPPPVQEPPMRDSFDIPAPVQEPPTGNSFDVPPPVQAPPMKSSFDLPPPDYNNNPSEVGFTKTQAPGQISDKTGTVENNFTPDQKQTITLERVETTYDNDQPINYNQVLRPQLPEIQSEFLPTKPLFFPPESQQKLPDYPSEIARQQPPMRSVEVLPSDSVAPKDAVFSGSPAIPNGGVGAPFNFQPVIPPNSQPPIAPSLPAPQEKPSVIPPTVDSTNFRQRVGVPEFRFRPNQVPGPSQISNNPPINSFSYQPAPNTFIQPTPTGNISPSKDFTEQWRNKFDTPQQPDSAGLVPIENIPSQATPTSGPQPLPAFTGQLPKNEMFGAVTQNFQKIVSSDDIPLQSPPAFAPETDITPQTAVKDSQFDYPTSTEKPEQSVSDVVPSNIGNQLSELTTYDKPILNSNDFQPEAQSYFTEPTDRNLDYSTQTPFYDSIPAAYKSEPESQPDLIPNVQNLSERPIAPAPEQALPPSGLESFPTTPLRPELPPSSPDVTKTESYSEQTRSEFGSIPQNSEFANTPRNGFQTVAPRPGPQFVPQQQTFGDDRYRVPMQRPNPIPEIPNPSSTDQPPLESNPVIPVQQQPQFYLNQNGGIQQPIPETKPTSQTFSRMTTQQQYETTGPEANKFPNAVPPQGQPITIVYPQPPVQSGVPNYEIQTGNQPPNAPNQPPNGPVTNEFYPEPSLKENQPFQAAPQSVLPYQSPSVQIPSAETQGQFINPETTSAESTRNTFSEMNRVGVTEYQSNIPPAGPVAGDSFPKEYPPVEQQSAGFDGAQMSQQNYPNPGFPSGQLLPADVPPTQVPEPQSLSGQSDSNLNYDGVQPSGIRQALPVDLPATPTPAPQFFSGQTDSKLNYNGVQPNGILQPEPRMPGNDQFSSQTNSNLQPIALPPQIGPMNSQNGVNPNELQTFVPSASPQKTGVVPFPPAPLQTVPDNSQVNSFPVGPAFGSTVSTPEVLAKETDILMPNPDQPSGVSQTERQDLNIQDQFPPAVPPQFTTQPSGEATTDYPNPYQPQPSEDYFGGVPGVQTTNRMLTSIDEYQTPAPTAKEPLNYFEERPDDVAQTTPPPFQADQFLTSSQYQSEYVQNNPPMYSPNLAPRPQPQPSFDNLTEFPGDKPAGSTTQTPLPSEIKPETFGSQRLRQTALTETNIPDTDNAKTPDARPKSGNLDYLGPQIYPNFDVPAPAVNYPGQDGRTLPPTADSITRDMTYQTTNPAFTPSQTVPTLGINPMETVFNSNSSYFSTAMTPSEGFGMQPFRQASALIASPQPQSTTVKYNERITIPQYQIPTASNPQPQATLKYDSRHSGDNTKEGLLDSVAWTFPGPQEAMVTAPPPQYQTTPLRSQFPPPNVEFNNEYKGRPFRPTQEQLVPVTQPAVTPSSEQQEHRSNGNTTIVVEEISTTEFPTELASSPVEDQLADKVLNSNTPIHEQDQGIGQKPQTQRQRIHFSPTKTREVVTESFVTPPTPFQQPFEVQNPPQMQSSSLTNFEEIETDSPLDRPRQFEETKIHPQPQIQSFLSTTVREVTTNPLVSPPPPFQTNVEDRPQQQLQSFSSTNMREVVADPAVIPPFRQQIDIHPQTEPRPFSSTISREVITDSFVSPPPPFEPQVEDQPQSQIQSSTSTREEISDSPVTVSAPFQHQTNALPQTQLQPFSSTITREVITDSILTPPFQQQIEDQPQSQLQELDPTNISEDIIVPPITRPPSLRQEIEVQSQPQFQPFPSKSIEEVKVSSPVTPRPPFPQKFVDQPQSELQYSTTITREGITAPLVAPTPSFQYQNDVQPQTQLQSFSSANIQKARTDSPVPAPPLEQQVDVQFVTEPPVLTPPPFEQQTNVQPPIELQPFSSTISREVVTDSPVSPPPSFQTNIEDQSRPKLEEFDSTKMREVVTEPPVLTPPPFEQQTNVQPPIEPQPFSSTISREIITDSLVSPPPPYLPQIEVRPQPQVQSFPSTYSREIIPASPVIPPPPSPQQIYVQQQTQLQPYSSTISREIVSESLVSPSPPFESQIEVTSQPQPEKFYTANVREDITASSATPPPPVQQLDIQQETQPQRFSSTISREVVTDSPVSPSPSFQTNVEDRPQSNLEGFDATNIRGVVTEAPVMTPPPFEQQTDVQPQIELQPFSSTISREVITDSLVSPPPPYPPQIEVRPQPQVQSFPSTNIREVITTSPVIPPTPFPQQTVVQTETEPQYPTKIMREGMTDSLVTPPPQFSQQVEVLTQPQPLSKKVMEITTDSPVTFPHPFTQQIEVPPQTQPQPFSSTISKEVVTESFKSLPPPSQPVIEVISEPKGFYTTSIREDITNSPVTPPSSVQQQLDVQQKTQPQRFSSTISREVITDSFVSPSPPFEPQIEVTSQPQPEEFYTANIREDITASSATPPPPVQQLDIQQETQPQRFSATISREVITDSVSPSPPFQANIEDQLQSNLEGFDSANIRGVVTEAPVMTPPPFEQQTDVQPQIELQPFSSTISREVITDSLVRPPPPYPPQIEVRLQPQVQSFPSTNIREVITTSPVILPTPFPQQTVVQPETELQPFSSTISREVITDSSVSSPPPFQANTEDQPQPNLEGFESKNIGKVVTEPPVLTPPPFEQQTNVQPPIELQPFSSTISREVVTDSFVSPSPPFEPQFEVTSQSQPEKFYTANVREDITASPATPPPPVQQIDVQQETQPQRFSSTISREVITDSVSPSPPFQANIEDRPQPQVQSFPSTNIREVITTSPFIPPTPFPQQTVVQPETELQPFSATISREIITDSLVNQPLPFEPQIESHSEPQPPSLSSNMKDIMTDSPVSPPLFVQQPLESQLQPKFQSLSSRSSKKIVTDSLVVPSPPLSQVEVQPQSERKSFSSTNSKAVLSDFDVNPPTVFQQAVEKQRQSDLQNFSSRNTTETVSDSTSLQGGRELDAFSAGNSTKIAGDSLVNSAAKLEKHVEQEFQTQRTRYTTTNTKEVITESFLPTSQSTYVESGNDGRLKSVTITSGPKGNSSHGTKTEVVEETITTDFPDLTQFSSLEDEFNFADKLLNNSTPVLNTTSVITASPFGKETEEKVVTTGVETQKPVDQIPVSTSENGVSPIKSTRMNYNQVLPIQTPREYDVVVASNLNSPRADRQSFKSDLGPIYHPKYSQSGQTTVSSLGSDQTVSSDFQTTERRILLTPIMTPDYQEHFNPLLQTLETHLNFPLHEPSEPSSSKPGPRRAIPLPLLGHSNHELRPTLPSKTTKQDTGPYPIQSQNSENAAQEMQSTPWHDPPAPVSNPTDPSNGPDPLRVLMNSSLDKMVPASSSENFWRI